MGRRAKINTPEVMAAKIIARRSIVSLAREPLTRYDVEGGCYERYRVRGGWIEVVDRGIGQAYFNVRLRLRYGDTTVLTKQPMHFADARKLAEEHVQELYEEYEKMRKEHEALTKHTND